MTERAFGFDNRHWWGVVVNVMDPDKEGRVQVRIHGLHDDATNIPDSALPWVKPLQNITSAAHNKIGKIPVGLIVGSTVFGVFLDGDQQQPIMMGTIAKAGDASSTETTGGSESLKQGTNSTPPGGRIFDNGFSTRSTQNIKTDDQTKITYPNYTPTEQNDSDGKDITEDARKKTKFYSIPTVASLTSIGGSILQQLQTVDPQNLNAVLPNAISSFIKMKDISDLGSTSGLQGAMGNMLGSALSSISGQLGASTVINALSAGLSGATLSSTAQSVLSTALMNMGQTPVLSDTMNSVTNQSLQSLINMILPLLQNGSVSASALESIIALFLEQLQNNGMQSILGAGITPASILSNLSSVLPTIAGAINTTLDTHLPKSVLDNSILTQALQKFSTNQAFLKAPTNGRKALAIKAAEGSANQPQSVMDTISSLPGVAQGVTTNTIQGLGNLFAGS
jgi:hypothetical protein